MAIKKVAQPLYSYCFFLLLKNTVSKPVAAQIPNNVYVIKLPVLGFFATKVASIVTSALGITNVLFVTAKTLP